MSLTLPKYLNLIKLKSNNNEISQSTITKLEYQNYSTQSTSSIQSTMLKKFFYLSFCIYFIHSISNVLTSDPLTNRKKMVLTLSQELDIKSVTLLKHPSFIPDTKIISFAKSLFQSHIYTSFLSPKQIELIMNDIITSKIIYSKTIILTFEEEFNDVIYKLISGNELGSSKYFWLVWNNKNQKELENGDHYIPYNCLLLIVKEKFGLKNNVSYLTEMYHPQILNPIMFKRNFGVWLDNEKLEIFETDLYERRIDMNRTVINFLFDPVKFKIGGSELNCTI